MDSFTLDLPETAAPSFALPTSPRHSPKQRLPRPPSIRGRLSGPRQSLSLSSILQNAPSPPSSPSEPSPPPSPSREAEPQFTAPRRKIRSRASRIARPKDSMPFARNRAARAASRFKSRGRSSQPGASANFSAPKLSRSDLAPSYQLSVRGPDDFVPDQPAPADDDAAAPLCLRHAEPCVSFACKRGANSGRRFFKCARPRLQQCDFFKWADQVNAATGQDDSDLPHNSFGNSQFPAWVESPPILPEDSAIDDVLSDVFNCDEWRPGQREAVSRLMQRQSVLAILPTAGGKSLIYQSVAALQSGLIVVITPLVSLIHSQRASLPDSVPSAALYGGQKPDDIRKVEQTVRKGEVKVLYVAPERLFTTTFQKLMEPSVDFSPVSLVVIDEAHCVSQWGHNFRTAYLRLSTLLSEPNMSGDDAQPLFGRDTPILALTATATIDTERDICKRFAIDSLHGVVRWELKRHNLSLTLSKAGRGLEAKAFELVRRLNSEPFATVLGIERNSAGTNKGGADAGKDCPVGLSADEDDGKINERARKRQRVSLVEKEEPMVGWGSSLNLPKRVRAAKRKRKGKANGCVIVYVSRQKDCESVRNYLSSSSLHICGSFAAYHGGMASQERSRVQANFEKGTIGVLIATVAFGMGIHCDRVSGVIHFDLPSSMESYSQEIGRAGRDGRPGFCHVFFNDFDAKRLLSRSHGDGIDLGTVRQVIRKLIESQFEYRKLSDCSGKDRNTKQVIDVHNSCDGSDGDDEGKNDGNDDQSQKEGSDETRYVLSMTDDELCKTLDVKFETGETIVAILEGEVPGLKLMRAGNCKLTVRFFSESPESLLKSTKSKALTRYDRLVIETVLRHAKHSNGQYTLHFKRAQVTEGQLIPVLRRLQNGGVLSFDVADRCLQVFCSQSALETLTAELRTRSELVFDELREMEHVRGRKAQMLVQSFRTADGLLSDGEQSSFLHDALDGYFAKLSGEDDDNACTEGDEQSCGDVRLKEVKAGAEFVCEEMGCGSARARTGRQIARVLHGLDGGRLRAKEWWRCKMWGRFIDVEFESVRRMACDVMRERHLLRKDIND